MQPTIRFRALALRFAPLLLVPAAFAKGSEPVQTVCEVKFGWWESGDAPLAGQNGGVGWTSPWLSGSADNVVTGGDHFDGGYALIAGNDQPAVRLPNPAFWNSTSAAGQQFGVDGHSFWVRFRSRRMPGLFTPYGSIAFVTGPTESVTIGCAPGTDAWGVQVPGEPARVVPGVSVDEETLLVARLDYQPGAERCRLWINPIDPHPDGPADVDTTVPDHTWEALRLQAGGGGVGFGFDDLSIEVPVSQLPPDIELSTPAILGSSGVPLAARLNFAPHGYDGNLYLMMCGMSGTAPGTALPPYQIPLNLDPILLRSIGDPTSIGLSNSIGTVNLDGTTVALHQFPASLPESIDLWYAYVLFDPLSQEPTKVSQPSEACTVIYP